MGAVLPRTEPVAFELSNGGNGGNQMNTPWIQVSIDTQDIEGAMAHLEIALTTGAEWIEAGTPLLTFVGIEAIATVAKAVPGRTVVADFNALDGVGQYFRRAGELGAGVATVMAAANDASVLAAVEAAHGHGVKVQADLLNVPASKMKEAAARLDEAVQATSIPVGPVVFPQNRELKLSAEAHRMWSSDIRC